jgi:glycosyltransferase involved in cell wall biosynthesis
MADRVLWIGGEVTADPRSGGALRTARLLDGLRRHADVDVVATDRASRSRVDRALVLAGVLAGQPRATARACSPAVRRTVARLVPRATYVVVEWAHLYPLVPRHGPYVLSLHNVEADRQPDARRLVAAEARLVRDPRATVVVVSERDREMLGPDAKIVPNGTDVPATTTPVPDDGDLLFVGAMDYPPNRLAVEWWSSSVWPLLPPGTPPLSVAGRNAETLPPYDGLRNLGEVASVAPLLDRAALVVVPLLHGGGTRLKVLEAFAANRPVLSTAKGVEGLDVTGGVECVLADEPAAFAAALTALLADPARRAHLAAAGRAVAERHAWGPIAETFARVVLDSPRRLP